LTQLVTALSLSLPLFLPAAAGAAAGGLSIEASPRQFLSGRDQAALLTVRGSPEQIRDLHLGCTHGSLRVYSREPSEVKAGLVSPLTSGSPSWVLCGAGAPGGQAMVALELQRRETLPLSRLPDLARVEVRIGSSLFGPVRANADGFAEVPVVLTPSVLKAEVMATPPGGATDTTVVRLSVQPTPQVLLLSPHQSMVADGRQTTSLYLFTLNDRGEAADLPTTVTSDDGEITLARTGPGLQVVTFMPHPRAGPADGTVVAQTDRSRPWVAKVHLVGGVKPSLSIDAPARGLPADGLATVEVAVRVTDQLGRGLVGQPVKLRARDGLVGPVDERPGGLYVARYQAPVEVVGETTLTAELEGAEAASLPLTLTPPPRITAELTPREIPADGRSRAVLSVTARGPDGRLLPDGTPVELSTTMGALPARVTTSGGRATAELLAGRRAGEVAIQVRALDATKAIFTRLLPGPAARLEVHPERGALVCDGRDSTLLRVRVQDAFGNPIDGLPIELSDAPRPGESAPGPAAAGLFERVAALGGGEFSFRYTAPPTCGRRSHELTAVAGAARGAATVGLRRGYSRPLAVTVRLGSGHPPAMARSGQIEVEGDARTAALAQQLAASATGTLSMDLDLPGGPGWVASVSLGPKWLFLEDERFLLYAGAGVDGHAGFGPAAPEAPAFGAHLRAGGGWAMGPGFATVQLRYGHLFLLPGGATRASPGGLSFGAGYQLPL
jgi:hypothetical protein